jgi:prolyl-tRNA synthetase
MGEVSGEAAGEPLRPVVAFLRGDHQVNETKLNGVAGTAELRPMTPEELELYFGGPAGYLGPVGLRQVMTGEALTALKAAGSAQKARGVFRTNQAEGLKTIVLMDLGLQGRKNLVAGANHLDYHFRNVTPGRDFTATLTADIRNINEGELDPVGGQPLRLGKAVEVGHIFKLGRRYTDCMKATVLDRDGKAVTPIMGCYGIGVERILTAAIETSAANFQAQNGTEGYALPPSIAPFEVIVTVTNIKEAALLAAAEAIAAELSRAGFDVLLDDRDERAGVKFKDADLTGVPFRIAVGKKLAEGKVELLNRLTGVTDDISVVEVVEQFRAGILGQSPRVEARTL